MAVKKLLSRAAIFLLVGQLAGTATAQLIRAPLDTGFARTSSIAMSVDEMLGSQKVRPAGEAILGPGYPDLWIAEVQYKPVRYRRMQITDPETGERKTELIWYMVYRVIPRDYTELAGDDGQTDLLKKLSSLMANSYNPVSENNHDSTLRHSYHRMRRHGQATR